MALQLGRVTAEALRDTLPEGVALIDFVGYYFCKNMQDLDSPVEARLLAFILRRGKPVSVIKLGPSAQIGTLVGEWRAVHGHPPVGPAEGGTEQKEGSEQTEAAKLPGPELRKRLWDPVVPYLEGAEFVLISPEGTLARLPFGALPGEKPGTYLIEEWPIAVVPVPRMLPQLLGGEGEAQQAGLLAIGAVDFDASPGTSPIADAGERLGSVSRSAAQAGKRLTFSQLPATAAEVDTVSRAFKGRSPAGALTELKGKDATENALRENVGQCSYVHVATHGFFAPPALKSLLELEGKATKKALEGAFHPGVLSGIALAGANKGAQEGGDDGIMTALEVAELDMSKADLVVLSACDTGLGKVAAGEGVLGLQRALQVAGARTVVASLWQVDDETTRRMMTSFYDNLWNRRMSKVEALRQAQLAILREGRQAATTGRGVGAIKTVGSETQPQADAARAHPWFWAAWVLSGDPGLD